MGRVGVFFGGVHFVFLLFLRDNILHLYSNSQQRTSKYFQSINIFSLEEIQEGGEVEGTVFFMGYREVWVLTGQKH